MKVTIDLPQSVARQANLLRDDLPAILRLGLQAWREHPTPTHRELAGVLRRLASALSPTQVLALRPSPRLSRRIEALLDKNREDGLSTEEEAEVEAVMRVEQLVRIAKANAAAELKDARR